jgi:NAD(P)H-flavin reductase
MFIQILILVVMESVKERRIQRRAAQHFNLRKPQRTDEKQYSCSFIQLGIELKDFLCL